jgi:hypothetical protein
MLIMVCIMLFAILFWPVEEINTAVVNAKRAAKVSQNLPRGQLEDQKVYSAIVQKPLFDPSRSMVAGHSVKVEKKVSITQAKRVSTSTSLPLLLGVMHVNGVDMAFIRGKGDIEPTGLKMGDKYQDWELTSISGTDIVLRKNETDATVSLDWGAPGEALAIHSQRAKRFDIDTKTSTEPSPESSIDFKDQLARQIDPGAGEDGGDGGHR